VSTQEPRYSGKRAQLINETSKLFQTAYGFPLSRSDAEEIVRSIAQYSQVLQEIHVAIPHEVKNERKINE